MTCLGVPRGPAFALMAVNPMEDEWGAGRLTARGVSCAVSCCLSCSLDRRLGLEQAGREDHTWASANLPRPPARHAAQDDEWPDGGTPAGRLKAGPCCIRPGGESPAPVPACLPCWLRACPALPSPAMAACLLEWQSWTPWHSLGLITELSQAFALVVSAVFALVIVVCVALVVSAVLCSLCCG